MPKKPASTKRLAPDQSRMRGVHPVMRAGFKANDNSNRPIFLYIDGNSSSDTVTVTRVVFTPTGSQAIPYEVVGRPNVGDGYIRLKVKALVSAKGKPVVGPVTGGFTVTLSVNQIPYTCELEALLYPE